MKIKDCELREVISCDKSENIVNVAKKLRDNKQRHIIVTESQKPVGIVSTTDVNNRFVAEDKDSKSTAASDIMTSPILEKDIEEPLTQVYVEMIKSNIFSCPVTEKGELKGVLDLKEVMNKLTKLKAN